jgi:hypothetical protein
MDFNSREFKLLKMWFTLYLRKEELGFGAGDTENFCCMINPEPIMRKLINKEPARSNIKADEIHKLLIDFLPKFIEQHHDSVLYIACPEELMALSNKLFDFINKKAREGQN